MAKERRRVLYSGRVQGVGFRFVTHRLAQGFEVAGFVRNLDDGRVELLAEGEPNEVSRFLEAIDREMRGKIRDRQTELEPLDDSQLAGFNIRY